MSPMEDYRFRKLVVWQRAIALAAEVHRITRRLRGREWSALADQMRRAAASIPANIAEGNGRSHRGDYLRFLSIAAGSLSELESHLELVIRLDALPPAVLAPTRQLLDQTARLLSRLIVSLRAPASPLPPVEVPPPPPSPLPPPSRPILIPPPDPAKSPSADRSAASPPAPSATRT